MHDPQNTAQAREDTTNEAQGQQDREPSVREVAEIIAQRLGETDEVRRKQIQQVVWDLGRTQAQALCEETLHRESLDQHPSAVFFQLVQTKGTKKERPTRRTPPPYRPAGPREKDPMVLTIAEQLGETGHAPLTQIRRAVKALGPDQTLALVKETLEIETNGGMMLPDQSRRRTPGGVFFHLLRTTLPHEVRERIFIPQQPRKPGTAHPIPPARDAPGTPSPPAPGVHHTVTWTDRIAALETIGTEKGAITTVKITLIGRPGTVVDQGTWVITSMQANKIPALPKGMPVPETSTTTYTVYIASKQWKNVAEAIKDAEDMLILEGFPALDTQTSSIAVFVSHATTKKLQQAHHTDS